MSSVVESSQLVAALVTLHRVKHRSDLIDWANAQLAELVEFSSMACLLAEPHGKRLRIRDVITSGNLTEWLFEVEPPGSAVSQASVSSDGMRTNCHGDITEASLVLIDRWLHERCAIRMRVGDPSSGPGNDALTPLMTYLGVDAIALHGVKEAFSGHATFMLLGVPPHRERDAMALEVLELIMPSLHIARQRIYRAERGRGTHRATIGLTPREIRILTMIAEGRTDDEAARLTGRSVHTIKNQVRHVVAKLGARNRTHAVQIAQHHELLQADGRAD